MSRKSIYNWSKIDPCLGTMSDKSLGKIFNIPEYSVRDRRRKLNIDSFNVRAKKIKESSI